MPRALNPDASIDLVLKTEQDLPDPPTFIFKAITVEEEEDLGRLFDRVKDDKENLLSTRLQEHLQPYLKGYKNMNGLTPETRPLVKLLCASEAIDLTSQLMASGRLSYEDKKKLESQALSGPDSFANPVAEVVVNNTSN